MQRLVEAVLSELDWPAAIAVLAAENLLIFLCVIALGAWVARAFAARRIGPPPGPLEPAEVGMAAVTVALNTGVTVAGLWLYRRGWVHFRPDVSWRAWLDVPVLLLAMDGAMYVLHRLVHVEPLFHLLHARHHRYERPRPLTLFVLNPLETLAFGGLWLCVIFVYPASWLGMSVYLALNVAFGAVGHLGVEPLPRWWPRAPVLREVATSTFHAQHHQAPHHNYGFYTLLWDRLFGTLSPDYAESFRRPG